MDRYLRARLIQSEVMEEFPIHPDDRRIENITPKDVEGAAIVIPGLVGKVDGPLHPRTKKVLAILFSDCTGHSLAGSEELIEDVHSNMSKMLKKYYIKSPTLLTTNNRVVMLRVYLHGWIVTKRAG